MAWWSTRTHFVAEIAKLAGQGVKVTPEILRIADNAPLILSLHRELDAIRENANSGLKIGTTKRGIGPAYEDKVGRRAIRVCDLARARHAAGQDRAAARRTTMRCAAAWAWPRSSADASTTS